MSHVKNIVGQKFGRLTVIEQHGFSKPNKHGQRYAIWYCRCDCGNFAEKKTNVLKTGKSSCGCIQKENLENMARKNIKHGMTNTRLYRIYKGMMNRCYYRNDIHYPSYGARGIGVCQEWLKDKSKFFEWAFDNGYDDNLTIERKDNNKGYSPENCTWIPKELQPKNKRQNIMITYQGKTLCAADWSKLSGIKANTIRQRYKRGWEVDRIFSTLPPVYEPKED